ncbi:hypothetical protein [Microvirga sp. Mcv34]|uniref:hypothetical protein n=1 Tax=Microvirga sp. Mcv34 TaxID=2926016 RepID=UPI0021CA4C56|nr:hypothetical protein [Microvirga sp. Mcv34]
MIKEDSAEGPSYDAELAADLIGKTLLVGLTYLDSNGSLANRRQLFGTVISCDERKGIVLKLSGSDELFTIAPITDAIEPAAPGVYQLSDEDVEVIDPDFTALLTVRKPVQH